MANLLIVPHSNDSSTDASPTAVDQPAEGTEFTVMAYPTVEALKAALTPPGGQPPRLLGAADSSDTPQHPTEVGRTSSSDGAATVLTAQHTTVGAGLFRIEINLASDLAGFVPKSALSEQMQLSETSGTAVRPMFALVGDAAVTAHYRLGVVRL